MINQNAGGKYKFATIKENYEDYSSGRVLYGAPGATGFPVRLISEIFQRAAKTLEDQGVLAPYSIYDPFCGAGYSLAVIGLLHGAHIKNIFASDANKDILVTANKNLSLLTLKGFNNRVKELSDLKSAYNKTSHKDALESTSRLKSKVLNIEVKVFEFNILTGQNLPMSKPYVDLVITDLPYGKLTHWEREGKEINPTQLFLSKIGSILKPKSLVVISADKKQKLLHEGYKRLEKLKLGKRQVLFLVKEYIHNNS